MRLRSCHQCDGFIGLSDFSVCQNKVVGEAITVPLKKEAELGRRVKRHWLQD